jgi:hypothetical protein
VSTKLPEQTNCSVEDVQHLELQPSSLYKFTFDESHVSALPLRVACDPSVDVTARDWSATLCIPSNSVLFYLGTEQFDCARHLTNKSCSCTSKHSWKTSSDDRMSYMKFLYNDYFVFLPERLANYLPYQFRLIEVTT